MQLSLLLLYISVWTYIAIGVMWTIHRCLRSDRQELRSRTPLLRRKMKRSEKPTSHWWQFWRKKPKQSDPEQGLSQHSEFDSYGACVFPVQPETDLGAFDRTPKPAVSDDIWSTETDLTVPDTVPSSPFVGFENPRPPPPIPATHFGTRYTIIRKIAYQVEGKVFLVKCNYSSEMLIIKQIAMHQRSDGTWIKPSEAEILTNGTLEEHQNILRLIDYFQDECRGLANVVYEYCDAGDIANFIEASQDRNEEVHPMFIMHFIIGMMQALCFLHLGLRVEFGGDGTMWHEWVENQPPIIHEDIKSGNVFLRWSSASRHGMPDIILGDFGFATADDETSQGARGTPAFWPREVQEQFDKERQDPGAMRERVWSPAGDMYSFGATLFHLITLKHHKPGTDIEAAIKASSLLPYPRVAAVICDMLIRCLSEDPEDRPQADKFLQWCGYFQKMAQEWYDAGGRIPQGMFPDPFYHDDMLLQATAAPPRPRQKKPPTFRSTPPESLSKGKASLRRAVDYSVMNPYMQETVGVSNFGTAFPDAAVAENGSVSPYKLSETGSVIYRPATDHIVDLFADLSVVAGVSPSTESIQLPADSPQDVQSAPVPRSAFDWDDDGADSVVDLYY